MKFVGGFFALELPGKGSGALSALWGMPDDPARTFANGRSALAALLASVKPAKLWLPAYICPSVLEAAIATGTRPDYYPVDERLEPDSPFLDRMVASGEMVLAVDYFGCAPGEIFLEFAKRRSDVLFVEDAAQAFDTGLARWGNWRLCTPRKLVGVADGGFVTPDTGITDAHLSVSEPNLDVHKAACLRFEDEEEIANAAWHSANQTREAAERVTTRRMSRLSRGLIEGLEAAPIAAARKANFRFLATMMPEIMLRTVLEPSFVPFGFPIRLPGDLRSMVRDALIGEGIFPAIHWPHLPSPPSFGNAHRLASELLTLPCDQRYSSAEMQRMAEIVLETLSS